MAPTSLNYAGKKFYVMTKNKDLKNKHKNNNIFYYTNHRIKSSHKKLIFKNNPYNKRNEDEFYMNIEHNDICNNIKPQIYENIADVKKNVYALSKYKEELLNF